MKMTTMLRKTALATTLAAALVWPLASQAGGLYLYEIGTSDLGFASAGTSARAEDASTVYANPAGMTRLAGDQFTLGAQALYGKADYQLDGQGQLSGSNPGNVIGWLPGGSAFYSHSVDDRLKLGLAVYGNFGLALDFGDQWAGRNLVDKTALMAMTIQPTVAYRLDDKWSLGGGVTANYGSLKLERVAVIGGGSREQQDGDWAFGARLGVMFEPSKSTRVGLVWNSKTEYNFDVDSTVTGLRGRTYTLPFSTNVPTPQQLMGSVYQRLSDRWAMMGNVGWQQWSRFSDTTIETNTISTTSSLQLKDTWHVAYGAQYTLNAQTRLNAGVAFDTSMYKNQSQTSFAAPNGDTWRFGVGMQYALSPKDEIGVAVEYLRTQSSSDPSALVSGSYDYPEMFFMSVNYSYRF
jgi:long-chain fatty acid transport protein